MIALRAGPSILAQSVQAQATGAGIMKAAFRTTLMILAALLPAAAACASDGWNPDGRGTSTWQVSPSEGTCNVSLARNRARRAGIYRTDLVYRDENVLTLRGLTGWGRSPRNHLCQRPRMSRGRPSESAIGTRSHSGVIWVGDL